jgi:hypothetical protein
MKYIKTFEQFVNENYNHLNEAKEMSDSDFRSAVNDIKDDYDEFAWDPGAATLVKKIEAKDNGAINSIKDKIKRLKDRLDKDKKRLKENSSKSKEEKAKLKHEDLPSIIKINIGESEYKIAIYELILKEDKSKILKAMEKFAKWYEDSDDVDNDEAAVKSSKEDNKDEDEKDNRSPKEKEEDKIIDKVLYKISNNLADVINNMEEGPKQDKLIDDDKKIWSARKAFGFQKSDKQEAKKLISSIKPSPITYLKDKDISKEDLDLFKKELS